MKHAILAILASVLFTSTVEARRPNQAPRPSQAPPCIDDVTPTAKTCLCSSNCVCGCNDNGVCDCNVTPAKPASQPTSYATFAELPAGTYQQIGGRYYPVQSQSMTYVQPQQYAIPSQRYSGFSSSGSCGPGGCR